MKDLPNLKDYSKKINLFTSENYFNFLDKEKSIVRIGEFLNELYLSYPSDSPLILKINASLKKYCEDMGFAFKINSNSLEYFFYDNVFLEDSFLDKLCLYDEISVDCFSFNQKYNPFLFIELLTQKDISLSFVITKREFINTNWFILSLSFCEEDYLYDMRKKLQKTGNIF